MTKRMSNVNASLPIALALLLAATGCGEVWEYGLSGTAKLSTANGQHKLEIQDGDEETYELSIRRHMELTFIDAANTDAYIDPKAPFDTLKLMVVLGHPIGGVGSNTLESASVSGLRIKGEQRPLSGWTVQMNHFNTFTFSDDVPESPSSLTHHEYATGQFAFTLTGPGGSPRYIIHDARFKALTRSMTCIEATGGCFF